MSGAKGVELCFNLAASAGTMYALDARTGAPLWSFNGGAPCNAGPMK